MSNVKGFIHGIYPRSEELIQISRDVIRKRRPESEYFIQYKKDCQNILALQGSLGLDFIEDGKLGWHDIFRPIVEATEGFEIGALTRWFDNNCFFRQPILKGKIRLDVTSLDKAFLKVSPAQKWKVTLPSPYTLSKLTRNETGKPFEYVLKEITELFVKLLPHLEKRGVVYVQFNEPYLVYEGDSAGNVKEFKSIFPALQKVKGNLICAFNFYFGDAAIIVKSLKKVDFIDVIGVDFYKTSLVNLPTALPYSLAAGILDGRNSLIEDEEELKKFIEQAVKIVGTNDLYLTNNSDLELLPESIAHKKVELLAQVRGAF